MSEEVDIQWTDLPTSTISDAMDAHGISGVAAGLRAIRPGIRAAGIARTAIVVEDGQSGLTGPGLKGLSEFIDEADAGSFLVLGWAAPLVASAFGGLAAHRARLRGCSGLIVDGWLRDVDEIAEQLPAWFRSSTPRTGRGRLAVRIVDYPITVGGTAMQSGDTVVADETGICVIPADRVDDVSRTAVELGVQDLAAARRLVDGASFGDA